MPRKLVNNNFPEKNASEDEIFSAICFRVVDNIDALLAYWDNNGVCRFANNSYLKLFGKSRMQMIGIIKIKDLYGHLYSKVRPYVKKALEGTKQVFELELNFPNQSTHHYIATYNPDKIKGKVKGFFAHMTDVDLIKKLDTKLLDSEKAKRREILRSVIETQETERELIAYELRDKVNQTLAYSKMMLGTAALKGTHDALLEKISDNIHATIDELNRISTNLTPSVITMIGFRSGIQEYIDNFKRQNLLKIQATIDDEKIENLSMNDKISVFRIVQNYLIITSRNPGSKNISINIKRSGTKLILRLKNNNTDFELPLHSKEFMDIEHRLEYYDGTWHHVHEKGKKTLLIELEIAV